MGNGFDINFLTSALNNVGGASSVSSQPISNEIKMFNTENAKSVNSPVYTDEDLAQMWLEAGVEPTEASTVASTTTSFAALEAAGFDLAELDEIFADEPEVVAHTLAAFSNGSASRISNGSQSFGAVIENLPEDAPAGFFDAFMYAINNDRVVA